MSIIYLSEESVLKQRSWQRSDSLILLIFIGWTAAVWQRAPWLTHFDTTVANFWHHSPQWFQHAMVTYTQLGNPHTITIITLIIGLALWLGHNPRGAVFFWVTTWLIAGYGNYLIKQVIMRPRPPQCLDWLAHCPRHNGHLVNDDQPGHRGRPLSQRYNRWPFTWKCFTIYKCAF